MIGQFFDTMILIQVHDQPIESGYNDPSNSKSWEVLKTVSRHLNKPNIAGEGCRLDLREGGCNGCSTL